MSKRDNRSRCGRVALILRVWLAGMLAVSAPVTARAYQEYGVQVGNRVVLLKWSQAPVRYFIEDRGVPGVARDQLQAAVDRAFTTWHNVPTASVSAQFSGYTSALPFDEDGMTTLGFLDAADEPDVLGETAYVVDDASGAIVEVDIMFNATFPWSVAASGESGHFDLESIALHEIGHLWGLGHSDLGITQVTTGGLRVIAKEAVMFPFVFSPGSISDRTLRADDIAGISDLYPADGFRAATGTADGVVTKNGKGVYGAHVVACSPTSGTLIGNFTDQDGNFSIAGLPPGPVVLRVEPVDNADLESFFDTPSQVDLNFQITYYSRFAVVGAGGGTGLLTIQVAAK